MHIPSATYRIQLTPEFGFTALKNLVVYLDNLGISDIYASPIFTPRQGSQHGYDIVEHNQLNEEIGQEHEFNALIEKLHTHDLGWIQDVVPNHMAFDSQNSMLMDVLEHGPNSEYFKFFDIQWDHQYERIQGKVLAPFLGKFYGEALENGELKLQYDRQGLSVNYYDNRFPIRIESYDEFFTHNLNRLKSRMGNNDPEYVKLLGVLYTLRNIPEEASRVDRFDQIQFIKRMLWDLYQENQWIREFIEENLELFNGSEGVPESYDLLFRLLGDQFYRLAFWKVGTEEINYRRFFNLNEFISLNMDDTDVFQQTHALLFDLIEEGKIQGVRVDHIDGLYDPRRYLKRLRNRYNNLYLVVEKILEHTEQIPEFWTVQGTTGYDFLNHVNGLFCRKENNFQFDKVYRKFSGVTTGYSSLVHEKKRLIIGKHMAGDVDNLAHNLARIAARHRYGSDFTLYGLRRALVEMLACFPVYRTYISEEYRRDNDQKYVDQAVRAAEEVMPDFTREFEFIRTILNLDYPESLDETEQEEWLSFVRRFQQMSGPLMAKGFEDTALYIYNRLVSLNEVGGDPDRFGTTDIEFHHFNLERAQKWPHAMNATSTHDAKRGEDVRARLNVLSELPMEWEQQVTHWSRLNADNKQQINGLDVPDPNDEYLLYQTLVGTYPFEQEKPVVYLKRIQDYLIKAVREAKIHTEWLQPDTDYEKAFVEFVARILNDTEDNSFLEEFLSFHQRIAYYGVFNSLSQVLLKITSPGLPDLYQGSELWDLNLVDPDNRRTVDFRKRKQYLDEIRLAEKGALGEYISQLFADIPSGKIKLFTIYQALQARKTYPELFQESEYTPLKVNGRWKQHVLAFLRQTGDTGMMVVIPRFVTDLIQPGDLPFGEEVWEDTMVEISLQKGAWRDILTGESVEMSQSVSVGKLFSSYPGAVVIGNLS